MPDYNDDDGKITIIAGKDRNWRTTYSTTVTFSARFATLVQITLCIYIYGLGYIIWYSQVCVCVYFAFTELFLQLEYGPPPQR
jgi:hypothetical protein